MNAEKQTLQGQPLLALKGITKHFGSVEALTGVDFEVYPGEVVALVGDNGAGKSTLVKITAGTYQADAGDFFFEGRLVHIATPQAASALGIATVYQDLALCDNLDIVANLYLGREKKRTLVPGLLSLSLANEMEKQALEVIRSLSTHLPSLRRTVATLSGGQRQSVAVSRAVLWGSKLVILDEPTAALGVEQTALVLRLIMQMRERGLGVVVITHNLANVFQIADRIIVLRLGRRVATFRRGATTQEQVVAAITGASQSSGVVAS